MAQNFKMVGDSFVTYFFDLNGLEEKQITSL